MRQDGRYFATTIHDRIYRRPQRRTGLQISGLIGGPRRDRTKYLCHYIEAKRRYARGGGFEPPTFTTHTLAARDGNQDKYTPYADLSFPLSKTLPEAVSASNYSD